jgi:hypothetical protein
LEVRVVRGQEAWVARAQVLQQVPGFREYILVETSEGALSIRVFADQTGADVSTRRAAGWGRQNLSGFFTGPPTVSIGCVWLHAVGGALSGTPAP